MTQILRCRRNEQTTIVSDDPLFSGNPIQFHRRKLHLQDQRYSFILLQKVHNLFEQHFNFKVLFFNSKQNSQLRQKGQTHFHDRFSMLQFVYFCFISVKEPAKTAQNRGRCQVIIWEIFARSKNRLKIAKYVQETLCTNLDLIK